MLRGSRALADASPCPCCGKSLSCWQRCELTRATGLKPKASNILPRMPRVAAMGLKENV